MASIIKELKNKKIGLLFGLVILILVVILTILSVNRSISATLRIVVAPASARILIDGEQYQNGIYENMPIGTKYVEITADGFVSKKYKIELAADEVTKLYACLEPESVEDFVETDEYAVNCSAAKELEGEKKRAEFLAQYPIAVVLPIVVEKYADDLAGYMSFRVDGGKYAGCEKEFCVKITDITGGNYERAKKIVKNKGYNLDDYEVIYVDESGQGKAF